VPRTILILIDGVSADAVARHPRALPTLHALAERGLRVDRLGSDVPATSLPGRVGMITGVPPAVHGVYGNLLLDEAAFRYATPDDVRVPTIAARARAAGLDVASVGYAMARPDDVAAYRRGWWVGTMIQRPRDPAPRPADAWARVVARDDADGRFAALAEQGWPSGVIDLAGGDRLQYLVTALEGDRRNLRWASALATAEDGPDLILAEILVPDSVQHAAGHDSPFSLWAMAYADMLVATLLQELDRAGRLNETNLLLASDHGHGPVATALYADRILPGYATSGEGGILYVAAPEGPRREEAVARLAEHGVTPLDARPLPDDVAPRLAAFLAPDEVAFESTPSGAPEGVTSGPPTYPSTHGARPGAPSDDRFLIAAGPDVPQRRMPSAGPADVEATLAALVGLDPGGAGRSLLDA
jgi:predicted AlkP superfamily pyrophosphatase or phosphodiesterase